MLRVFLEAMREIEDKMIDDGYSFTHQRLSSCMEQSMENGLFGICLAARNNTMFDEIYWAFIDQQYHGMYPSVEDRMRLLDQEQQHQLEELVRTTIRKSPEDEFHHFYPIEELLEL